MTKWEVRHRAHEESAGDDPPWRLVDQGEASQSSAVGKALECARSHAADPERGNVPPDQRGWLASYRLTIGGNEYAECSECSRVVMLTRNGVIRKHLLPENLGMGGAYDPRQAACIGSGKAPR